MTGLFTLTAEPALSRVIYGKTAGLLVVLLLLLHLSGQWRNPPLINARLSLLVCGALGLAMLYGLTRTPFTRSLMVDSDRHLVVIHYMTLTRATNRLEIPFDQLALKLDKSFATKGYGTQWKVYLLRNHQEVYDLRSTENGFTEPQMNDFLAKLQACLPA